MANFVAEVQEQPMDANEAVEAQGHGVEQIHQVNLGDQAIEIQGQEVEQIQQANMGNSVF